MYERIRGYIQKGRMISKARKRLGGSSVSRLLYSITNQLMRVMLGNISVCYCYHHYLLRR